MENLASQSAVRPPPHRQLKSADAHSRPARWAMTDGRSREGQLIRAIRADLLAHVGEKPSAVQRMLVERAVMLSVHLARMDAAALSGPGEFSEFGSKRYLAWSNSLSRTLNLLGLHGAEVGNHSDLSSILDGGP